MIQSPFHAVSPPFHAVYSFQGTYDATIYLCTCNQWFFQMLFGSSPDKPLERIDQTTACTAIDALQTGFTQ